MSQPVFLSSRYNRTACVSVTVEVELSFGRRINNQNETNTIVCTEKKMYTVNF